MNSVRAGQPGATRLCPHCKATVLESATICPGCRHHLRFSGGKQQFVAAEAYTAFSVDGSIAHRQRAEPCEYCIVLEITNERGEQIMRQVVGVGALQSGEQRRLNVTVDMLPLVAVQPRPAVTAAAPASPTAASGPREPSRTGLGARAPAAPAPGVAAPRPPGVPGSALNAAPAPAASPTAASAAAALAPLVNRNVRAGTGARATTSPTSPVTTSGAPGAAAGPSAAAASDSAASTPAAPSTSTPGAAATTKAATPGSSATLGQRLRIFRKP